MIYIGEISLLVIPIYLIKKLILEDIMKKDKSIYWTLFTSTFQLSAFTFGGGFVIVPLMKKKFVDNLKWIDEEDMIDIAAIAQSSPGAIAVNGAILLGYNVAGLIGALISAIGTILPPLIIISVISLFYSAFRDNLIINALLKGMQAGIAAVVIDVSISMATTVIKTKKIVSILMIIGAFVATFFFNISVVIIILVCAIIGVLSVLYQEKARKEDSR